MLKWINLYPSPSPSPCPCPIRRVLGSSRLAILAATVLWSAIVSPSCAWSHRVRVVLLMFIGMCVYIGVSATSALASAPDLSGTARLTSPTDLSFVVGAVDTEELAVLDDRGDTGSRVAIESAPSSPALSPSSRPIAVRRIASAHPCRQRAGATRSSDDTPG